MQHLGRRFPHATVEAVHPDAAPFIDLLPDLLTVLLRAVQAVLGGKEGGKPHCAAGGDLLGHGDTVDHGRAVRDKADTLAGKLPVAVIAKDSSTDAHGRSPMTQGCLAKEGEEYDKKEQ